MVIAEGVVVLYSLGSPVTRPPFALCLGVQFGVQGQSSPVSGTQYVQPWFPPSSVTHRLHGTRSRPQDLGRPCRRYHGVHHSTLEPGVSSHLPAFCSSFGPPIWPTGPKVSRRVGPVGVLGRHNPLRPSSSSADTCVRQLGLGTQLPVTFLDVLGRHYIGTHLRIERLLLYSDEFHSRMVAFSSVTTSLSPESGAFSCESTLGPHAAFP